MLTQEELKRILYYHPSTGQFVWLESSKYKQCSGKIAGSRVGTGYIHIGINQKYYQAHRLAFLYMTGSMPRFVDHINRTKNDNRWENLRETTRSLNTVNGGMRSDNTSGYKGVYWNKKHSKWCAKVRVDGKYIHIGYYDCPKDGSVAYKAKRKELFGEFAND